MYSVLQRAIFVSYLLAVQISYLWASGEVLDSQPHEKPSRHRRRHSGPTSTSTRRRGGKPDWTVFHQRFPLKPSPVMIPLDIEERQDSNLDPDVDRLDEYELLSLLDTDYNREFMSLRQPLDMILNPNGTLHYQFKKTSQPSQADMPVEIQALSAKEVPLPKDGPALRIKFSKKKKAKLQRFLWAYSYCPVRYKWKKLSIRFWPRWIKTGSCDNQRSCSIPAGMTCQPTQMKNIRILRYYCPIPGSKNSCQWIKFEYPILEKCTCMCEDYNKQSYG